MLVADATCRKKCVDAGNTAKFDTWVGGEDVATTGELCVEYNLLSVFCITVSGVRGVLVRTQRSCQSARQQEGQSVRNDDGGWIQSNLS